MGGGDFVDGLKQQRTLRDWMNSAISLARVLEIVSLTLALYPDLVRRPSKCRAPAAARSIICHLAIFEVGYTGNEVGIFLHLGPTGVCLTSRRNKKLLKSNSVMLNEIMGSIDK